MKNLQILLTLFMLVSFTLFLSNCKKEAAKSSPPTATFTFTGDNNPAPCTVTFSNTSTNATSYSWNFGDGSPTATEQNPQHVFTTGGTFNVILIAKGDGGSNSTNKIVTVKNPAPGAHFTFTGNNNPVPCLVTFTNSSTFSTSYSWNFGDNSPVSTDQNPQHTYTTGGNFSVVLTATGSGGTSTATNTVSVQYPVSVANFTFTGNTSPSPCLVTFTNSSVNATSYSWNFGDNSMASAAQNPQHTYTSGGTYTVSLTATGPGGSNIISKSISVPYSVPLANFTFTGDNNPAPCQVTFTNYSTNATSYSWNFGDGTISSAQNPQHIFTSGGNYLVQLTAMGPGGTNSITKSVNILYPASGTDVTFNNPIFTDIQITLNGNTQTIYPGSSVTFYSVPGSSVSYTAYTYGVTTTGSQIGVELDWNYTITLPGGTISYNLVSSSDYFFMFMKNEGTHNLTPIKVNQGYSDETTDYILIPDDYVNYNTGYYPAHSYTEVDAYYQDSPTNYTYWYNINFPWTINQSIQLINTYKKAPRTDGRQTVVLNPKLPRPAVNLNFHPKFDAKAINVPCK